MLGRRLPIMAKRGENIYKRKDGRYEGRYIKGYKADGKPLFGYVYAYTYKEVKAALVQAKTTIKADKTLIITGAGTLKEYLESWMHSNVKDRVKASTYAQYYDRINKHIIPEIGQIQINHIDCSNVQDFVNGLNNKKLATSTIYSIVSVLHSALKEALKLNLISFNPCEGVYIPKKATQERRPLTRYEQIQLEQQLIYCNECVTLGVLIALYAGLRIGEICALQWKDIDLLAGSIIVSKTLQRIKNFDGTSRTLLVEGKPKSKYSIRKIPLPPGLIVKLNNCAGNKYMNNYVLSGSYTPVEPRTLRAGVAKLTKSINLDIPFHSLRHTYATRCLENNFDIHSVSELLGHSGAIVTSQVYAHSLLEHKRLLVSRLNILSE